MIAVRNILGTLSTYYKLIKFMGFFYSSYVMYQKIMKKPIIKYKYKYHKLYINNDNSSYYHIMHSTQKMEKMADVLRKDLNIIVDVGGNCGIFAYFVKKRHPQAKLYIFEPSEHLNQVIKHNLFAFEKWEIIQKVVSDSDNKELEFYINPCSQQTNSLIKENVLPFTTNDSIIKENVKSITIDRFCRENNINHIDLLKVDIQGHEYYMLEGAKESLAKTEYAIFEMSFLDKNILKTLQVLDVYFEISQIINEVKYGADILFKRKNEKN